MICWRQVTILLRAVHWCALVAMSVDAIGAEPLILFKTDTPAAVRAAPRQAASRQSIPPAEARPTARSDRRLLPPTRGQIARPAEAKAASNSHAPKLALPKIDSFTTAGAGLAIVVGLFLACMWMLRHGGPKPTSPLPSEAVAVLGRVPLAARNFAHLLQVGNKLILIAITPDGVAPITEITDPLEVQRMLGLCLRNHKQSTTAEFHSVLQQLAKEPANGFLGKDIAASYASHNR